ncbi:MAG: hypothetical protein LBQ68_08755 [Clostridiales bacterium]|jgi:hypothetical protein|nr:hypothetical protein [Clostridiales bacterium]
MRAEIRAIKKLNLAKDLEEQKWLELQQLSEAHIDAQVVLGTLIRQIPKVSGGKHGNQYKSGKIPGTLNFGKSKLKQIADLGFNSNQASDFELMSRHAELVEQSKQTARKRYKIISSYSVLEDIKKHGLTETEKSIARKKRGYYKFRNIILFLVEWRIKHTATNFSRLILNQLHHEKDKRNWIHNLIIVINYLESIKTELVNTDINE